VDFSLSAGVARAHVHLHCLENPDARAASRQLGGHVIEGAGQSCSHKKKAADRNTKDKPNWFGFHRPPQPHPPYICSQHVEMEINTGAVTAGIFNSATGSVNLMPEAGSPWSQARWVPLALSIGLPDVVRLGPDRSAAANPRAESFNSNPVRCAIPV